MIRPANRPTSTEVATLTLADHLRALTRVLLPSVVKGPIIRRPRGVALAQRLDADTVSVTEMQRLRDRYGSGPVQLNVLGRRMALLLDPDDVHRALNEGPRPFTLASLEKRGALNHFQPAGTLVSTPEHRLARRPFNERVLEAGRPIHSHADAMTAAVTDEVDALLGHIDFEGTLDWDAFAVTWWRIVRRIVLGDSARDDEQVSDDLRRLRERANFSYLAPQRPKLRERLLDRLQHYIDRAEPGSLASIVAQTPASADTEPREQLPQWLFAFDAAAWATFRALALLSAHPESIDRARTEIRDAPDLPYLRATVLESLRLWPTTPLLLRDTTETTTWRNGRLRAGTGIVIFAPYFHRDDTALPREAHTFSPELWLRERDDTDWPLVPFSGGPGMCPGRNVVLLAASMVLGRLIEQRDFAADDPLQPGRLPGTLSPFSQRFTATPVRADERVGEGLP